MTCKATVQLILGHYTSCWTSCEENHTTTLRQTPRTYIPGFFHLSRRDDTGACSSSRVARTPSNPGRSPRIEWCPRPEACTVRPAASPRCGSCRTCPTTFCRCDTHPLALCCK